MLVLALALLAAISATTGKVPGAGLAGTIADRLICAVRLTEDCRREPELRRSYGADLAALLRAHAPALLYEEGMSALPVDFRSCRQDPCASGPGGSVSRSRSGEPVVAFTHAIDCRPAARPASEAAGAGCSGERAGNLYLQYWFYYPGSATAEGRTFLKRPIREASARLGTPSYHPDDWESYQVRVGPAGRFARASSHHGYSYELGGTRLVPGFRVEQRGDGRLEIVRRPEVVNGWGPDVGTLYVSGGSHAGNARVYRLASRATKDHRLVLVPIERLAGEAGGYRFAVTPPWLKRVYRDPEYAGTD